MPPRIPRHTEEIKSGTKRRELAGEVVEIFQKEEAISDEQRQPFNASSDSPIITEEPTQKMTTSTPPTGVGLFATVQAMFKEISSEILVRPC